MSGSNFRTGNGNPMKYLIDWDAASPCHSFCCSWNCNLSPLCRHTLGEGGEDFFSPELEETFSCSCGQDPQAAAPTLTWEKELELFATPWGILYWLKRSTHDPSFYFCLVNIRTKYVKQFSAGQVLQQRIHLAENFAYVKLQGNKK